ncbi:MAG: DUF2177 family protein [Xanthobacteraceae bacterium]|nr:DUF2177 family protein [Xanthobacteraceae bacterium]
MMTYVTAYLATLIVFLAADMVWLGTMVDRVYRPALGDMLSTSVNFPPAIVFYLIYPIGLLIFAVLPAVKSGSVATAATYGALFGFFTYATYDLTNYATLRNWTLSVTAIDMAWGTVLGALASAVGCYVVMKFVAAP